jgi:hypothetical protein
MSEVKLVSMNPSLSFFYYSIQFPAWIHGTIIDLETTGLKADTDELIGLGLIKENRLSAFIRSFETEDRNFRSWVSDKVRRSPKPYIAYYNVFEKAWLDPELNIEGTWIEIQPKRMQKKTHAINIAHLEHRGTGKEVPYAWHKKDIALILHHLVSDMFEELSLYLSLSHEIRRKRNFILPIWEFGRDLENSD